MDGWENYLRGLGLQERPKKFRLPIKGIELNPKGQDQIRLSALTKNVVIGTTVREVKEGANR